MQIQVLVEPIEGDRFRASYTPLDLVAEGDTRASVISELRAAIDRRMAEGVEFTKINISVEPRRTLEFMGTMEDDAMHREWLAIIAENRRRADFEEGIILDRVEAGVGA